MPKASLPVLAFLHCRSHDVEEHKVAHHFHCFHSSNASKLANTKNIEKEEENILPTLQNEV
jgi:hypothetical protein